MTIFGREGERYGVGESDDLMDDLRRVARLMEDFVRTRGGEALCAHCGRPAMRFRLMEPHGVLCEECAPDGRGSWHTVESICRDFAGALSLTLNAYLALLGFHVLAERVPGLTGRREVVADPERLMEDCLELIRLEDGLAQMTAALRRPSGGTVH